MAKRLVTVSDLLTGQDRPDIECADRVRLNRYVPTLQIGSLDDAIWLPAPAQALDSFTAETSIGQTGWGGSLR